MIIKLVPAAGLAAMLTLAALGSAQAASGRVLAHTDTGWATPAQYYDHDHHYHHHDHHHHHHEYHHHDYDHRY